MEKARGALQMRKRLINDSSCLSELCCDSSLMSVYYISCLKLEMCFKGTFFKGLGHILVNMG